MSPQRLSFLITESSIKLNIVAESGSPWCTPDENENGLEVRFSIFTLVSVFWSVILINCTNLFGDWCPLHIVKSACFLNSYIVILTTLSEVWFLSTCISCLHGIVHPSFWVCFFSNKTFWSPIILPCQSALCILIGTSSTLWHVFQSSKTRFSTA
jgi:hypothetical protein